MPFDAAKLAADAEAFCTELRPHEELCYAEHRFNDQLVPLAKKHGIQVLCYGQGDYAGPHTDHHPEDARAKDGYIDVHLSLTNEAVAHQWLVYARRGHFSEVTSAALKGGLTGYRLPFWYYTTPLHLQPALRFLGWERGSLAETERAAAENFSVPLWPGIAPAIQERVVDVVRSAVGVRV